MFVDPETENSREYAEFWAKLNRGEFTRGEYKTNWQIGQRSLDRRVRIIRFSISMEEPYKVVKLRNRCDENEFNSKTKLNAIAQKRLN